MLNKIPLWVKILIVILCPPTIILWLGIGIFAAPVKYTGMENKLFAEVVNNPCEETANAYIMHTRNKSVFTFLPDNNPSPWAVLR